ncbi:MAG: alpha-ketoglutarate-dependent dioxygenase AlkB [Mycobacteriales bacterium]
MTPGLAYQGSLFDGGSPQVDVSFARLRRITLDDRSWVDYCPGWLRGSDDLFAELLEVGQWRARELWMYDRMVREPRLTAGWLLGDGVERRTWTRHGGDDREEQGRADVEAASTPMAWHSMATALSERYGVRLDSVWVNLYRDGRDSVAWHGDRNAKVLTNPLVVTVSLGARRKFLLRARGTTRATHRLDPGGGDLVVMGGACQHDWSTPCPRRRRPWDRGCR